MNPEEIFATLTSIAEAIKQKHIDIQKKLEVDKQDCDAGIMTKQEQVSVHTQRYQELKDLNQEFEQEYKDAVNQLLGKDAESNPFLAKRIAHLLSTTANEQEIQQYGSDRIQQLRDLYESINNLV